MINSKQPLDLALKELQSELLVQRPELRFVSSDFAFIQDLAGIDSPLFEMGRPYRLKEGRVGLCMQGEAEVSINLIDYKLQQGMAVILPPGTITLFHRISPDFNLRALLPGPNFLIMPKKDDLLDYYMNVQQTTPIPLTTPEQNRVINYFSLIWDTIQEPVFRREAVQHLTTALLCELGYICKHRQTERTKNPTRQEELFQRFVSLVSKYCKTERTVNFYADKLCLTPGYLNTAIRQASGQTVMEWVNRAVLLEAQVLLRHSDMLVFQIADELNFPNPSFFSKFFKQKTGMTPLQYQKQ